MTLAPNPAHDLGAALSAAQVAWSALNGTERRYYRIEAEPAYAAAGWTVCDHPTCPPWDCRPDLFDDETEDGV